MGKPFEISGEKVRKFLTGVLLLGALFLLSGCRPEVILETFPESGGFAVRALAETMPETTAEPIPETTSPEPLPTETEPPETGTVPENTGPTAAEQTDVDPAGGIVVVSGPGTVAPGDTASVQIQGQPETEYQITVLYRSGPSQAKGLEPKVSDSEGTVSWSWKVGSRTSAGTYEITVTGGGETVTFQFTVT